ncbi:MAG: hypothetical protein V1802_02375 [Candidatus Aenigmatarchaeota archaeon]
MVEITTTFKFLTMIITLALVITIFAAGKDIVYKWLGKPDEDMFFTLSPKYKGTINLTCIQATADEIANYEGNFKFEILITNLGIVYDGTQNVDAIPVVFFKEKIAGSDTVKLEKDGKNVFSMTVTVYSNTGWGTNESFFIGFFKSNELCVDLSHDINADKNTFVKQCVKRLIGGVRLNGKCGKEVPIE